MKADISTLVEWLRFKRPAYSLTEKYFCEKYLEPIFGKPDEHGNYIKIIGDHPTIAFTAHTDTVHKTEGIQHLEIEDNIVRAINSNCLGADCTTGLWLLAGMIEAGIEGVYVAHAAEEIGGIGSTALVKDDPHWLRSLDACISFDRFGKGSVITHQSCGRTASDAFAVSLGDALGLGMAPDAWGTYTDSMEYADIVPECSNISVGYDHQHTAKETQDLLFAQILLERLIEADWSSLAIERDPTLIEYAGTSPWYSSGYSNYGSSSSADDKKEIRALARLVEDRPEDIAQLLFEYGFNIDAVSDELGLEYSSRYHYLEDHTY